MTIEVFISQREGPHPSSMELVTGIVAQPGGQTNATPLTGRRNVIANCVSGAGVILQLLPLPDQKVFNACGTGQAALVFPPVNQKIATNAMNAPVSIADQDAATFTFDGVMTWLVS